MASVAGGDAALMISWRNLLYEAAAEVFSMMVGANLVPGDGPELAPGEGLTGEVGITGTIGIAGAMRAILSVRCSVETATKIASHMLGVSMHEAAAQKGDAIGEICNMMAGQFKAKIGLEAQCMLTVPTIISGRSYSVHSPAQGKRLKVPVLYDGEPVTIALDIPK